MSTKLSAGRVRTTYAFIKANRKKFSIQMMCACSGSSSPSPTAVLRMLGCCG
jgi:hypothetical protein